MKYNVTLDAQIVRPVNRTYTVEANSEEEAVQKANKLLRRDCAGLKNGSICTGHIEVEEVKG